MKTKQIQNDRINTMAWWATFLGANLASMAMMALLMV